MPSIPASVQPAARAPAGRFEQRDGFAGLLRNAHIFASVVRDVLEIRLLRQVSSDPLTLRQFNLLRLISRNGHHQVGDVARLLGVSAAAATKNVDKLERLGLVDRVRSEDDRRATLLASTSRGRRLVHAYEAIKMERLAPVLDGFTDDELALLATLLDRLSYGLLEDEVGGDRLCLRCSAYYDEDCSIRRLGVRCPYVGQARRAGKEPAG